MPTTSDGPAERLRLALDLFAAGEAIMRQNLKRRHPEASEAEVESDARRLARRAARSRARRRRRACRAMAETPHLNRLEAALRGMATLLSGRRWAIVGDLAVSVRCEPRFTRDLDLALAVASDAEAEGTVHSLLTALDGLLARA